MTEQEFIVEVKRLVAEGKVSKEKIFEALREPSQSLDVSAVASRAMPEHHAKASSLFYGIGAAIVVIGIGILVWDHWTAFSSAAKVLLTLGSAILTYFLGTLFWERPHMRGLATAFHFIAALLFPIGVHVTFRVAGIEPSIGATTAVAALLALMYWVTYRFNRNDLFLAFSIIFTTYFYYALTDMIMGGRPVSYWEGWDFAAYRTIIAGITYIMVGRFLARVRAASGPAGDALTRALYGFGCFGVLAAGISLTSWSRYRTQPADIAWDFLFPVVLFSFFFLSTRWRVRSFLSLSSLFLIAYISKITYRYFSRSTGWPVALIIAGLGLIAVGFLFVHLNRRYIKRG